MVLGKGEASEPGSWPTAPRAKWGASRAPGKKRNRAADAADGCVIRCCEDVDPGSVNELLVEADGTEVRLIRCCCTTCPERNGERCRAVLALVVDEVDDLVVPEPRHFVLRKAKEEAEIESSREQARTLGGGGLHDALAHGGLPFKGDGTSATPKANGANGISKGGQGRGSGEAAPGSQ